jgi:hypothetical protein
MGGYEIQNLSYKTFWRCRSWRHTSITKRKQPPNGFPFTRDFDQGEISGLNGGDLDYSDCTIYDTRDFEPDPTSGYYFEIQIEYSGKYIGSCLNLTNCFYKEKGFGSCLSVRTVVVDWELEIYLNAPFLISRSMESRWQY